MSIYSIIIILSCIISGALTWAVFVTILYQRLDRDIKVLTKTYDQLLESYEIVWNDDCLKFKIIADLREQLNSLQKVVTNDQNDLPPGE